MDYIGYKEGEYNFDFADSAEDLLLKVGSVAYTTAKTENMDADATSTYSFTAPGAAEATFFLEYYRGNGKDTEHFVWTINEDVSKFAPVSITYTLELTERIETVGEYEAETNITAILYPKDSDGKDGDPEPFPVPVIEYSNPEYPEIGDPDVPLAPAPEIDDPDVPKADLPDTGDTAPVLPAAVCVFALVIGGVAVAKKRLKD